MSILFKNLEDAWKKYERTGFVGLRNLLICYMLKKYIKNSKYWGAFHFLTEKHILQ